MTSKDIATIVGEALEAASPEERNAYLNQECRQDSSLRQRVDKLLQDHAKAGDFLEQPAFAPAVMTPSVSEGPGTMIGPYKLLEQIGEGGFGVVFMAEQLRPIRRKVALKVIKPGMDTKQVVARFEAERQSLALMDNPNIARVLDAGTTESGRPYFVMELVRGFPITAFCDEHRLSTRERLRLFIDVCRAIQHAHQKGIIHRDIKPSNVLVTQLDGAPLVKVIDFGIAKAMGQQLTDKSLFTGFAQLIGTPLYMSPEQAAMNAVDVDTRCDVYSLGVLLYELMTGTTPFEKEILSKSSHDEWRRIIREDDPPRPSDRISTLEAAARSTISDRRQIDPQKLARQVRGEMDWIVMKALEKDRNRRYESASAFATDVQRYLDDEPVEACPPSAGYRLRKYLRRNRRILVPAGVITVVLIVTTAVSVWQAVQATAARRLADERLENEKKAQRVAAIDSAVARAVNDFLQHDLLQQVDSAPQLIEEFSGNPNLTVREALDRAAAKIGERFHDEPLVEAAIRKTIGEAYGRLNVRQVAIVHLERAVALLQAHLGPNHRDTLDCMQSLALAYSWVGRHPDAIALNQKILDDRMAVLGPNHPDVLACECALAGAYYMAGKWDTSVRLWEHLLENHRATYGPTHPATLGILHELAINYANLGRHAESMALYEQVLEPPESTTSPVSQIYRRLGFAYACQQAGRLDQAERLLREALELARNRDDSLGRIQKANTLGWLARTLLLKKQYAAAEPLVREALAIFEKEEPENSRHFYWTILLGTVFLGQQKYAEAEPLLLQGYEGMKQREDLLPASEKRRLAEAGERVVQFYESTNQQENARVWREKLMEVKSKQ